MKRIHYNSPVILTYALISLAVLGLGYLTNGLSNRLLFSVYRGSWADPLGYFRLFGHALGHANLGHYAGNFLLILLIGPVLEEKYGSKKLLITMFTTAVTLGILHRIFGAPNVMVLGASGVVFALIVLSSFVNMQAGRIPLTLVAVISVYLGREVWAGVSASLSGQQDGISQFMHIFGGVCGLAAGFLLRDKPPGESPTGGHPTAGPTV
ncbi:MAG: rhomboid family intramembrane serine protease [Oscillospiraceae bacterium]|nr:rhomboid family intramembrane serine protease [Oscillospiraceae bacterium]